MRIKGGLNIVIYYAHHLWKYNTPIEQYELDLISKAFPCAIIINPNTDIEQDRGNAEIMKDCLSAVDKCDALVFSSVNGVIGKGVYDEFHRAKVTYYINNNTIEPFYGSFEIIPDSTTGRLFAIVKN